MKKCTKCLEASDPDLFPKTGSWCKPCKAKYLRQYQEKNKASISEKARQRRERHADSIKAKRAQKYIENKESMLAKMAEYRRDNAERLNASKRKRRQDNLSKIREQERQSKLRNKDGRRLTMAEYRREARKNNPEVAIVDRLRARLGLALRGNGYTKRSGLTGIVGCSFKDLCEHLESQFSEGMSWSNRSDWHIDHIIPLSSASDEDGFYKLCHYTNLQPLWATDNLKKSAKMPDQLSA